MNEESVISVRVDGKLHAQMKLHDEVNWSAILRMAIASKIEELEHIDTERAKRAAKKIDAIRKSGVFDSGKSSTEIIREWRDKRR